MNLPLWVIIPGSIILLGCVLTVIILVIKGKGSISYGDLKIDMSQRESVKDADKNSKIVAEAKRNIEEYTRSILAKQYGQVIPFLQSLRPIFNRLVYSIMDSALAGSLGVEKTIVTPQPNESCDILPGSHYRVETVKVFELGHKTRMFTSLVESTVDSLLGKLEREIYIMLVNNNIGKNRDEVRAYIHLKSENLIGVIRNCLCDSYNDLSNQNLFDTKPYWEEIGITYPVDWIEDKLYKLFVICMQCRYCDFED